MPVGMNAIATAAQSLSSLSGPGVSASQSSIQSALHPGSQPGISSTTAPASPQPFADLLVDAVGSVNKLEDQARSAVTGLISGTGVDVHQAMIATQKADMAFELALAVRNKAVQAYQTVVGMQF